MLQVLSLGGDGKGVVAGYVHGAMGAGMGKNAALVALKLGELLYFDDDLRVVCGKR